MLKHSVFAFRVLADNEKVHVLVASLHSREGLAMHRIGKEIELITKLNVAGDLARPVVPRLDVSFDAHSVPLDRRDGVEEIDLGIGVGIKSNLLEIDGHARISEHLLDVAHHLRPDSVSW